MNDNNQPTIGDRVYVVLRFADANGTHQVRIVTGKYLNEEDEIC